MLSSRKTVLRGANMQVHKSVFIIEKKPLLKKLLSVLLEKYEYVSILATDSDSKNYRVSSTGTSIGESGFLCERGFVMKVYDKGRFVEYSFNEISEDSIAKIAGAVDALVASKKKMKASIILSSASPRIHP